MSDMRNRHTVSAHRWAPAPVRVPVGTRSPFPRYRERMERQRLYHERPHPFRVFLETALVVCSATLGMLCLLALWVMTP